MEILKKKEILKRFTREELIMEAECVEEYGEYIHMELMGYSADELYALAKKAKS